MSFQLYSGGVLTAACGTNLDHGVLLVGYGVSEDGIKYWKVRPWLVRVLYWYWRIEGGGPTKCSCQVNSFTRWRFLMCPEGYGNMSDCI